MEQTIITFVLTIISGFISGYVVRQSGHDKWLIEKRAESFAKFFTMLSEARTEATNLIYDNSFKEKIFKDIKITETYLPVLNQAMVVCLFIHANYREEFYKLVKEFTVTHGNYSIGQNRLVCIDKKLERIQEIFEAQLEPKFWTLPKKNL